MPNASTSFNGSDKGQASTGSASVPASSSASPSSNTPPGKSESDIKRHSDIVDVAKSRRLNIRPLPNGKWKAFDQSGSVITTDEYTEYEDAVEAAGAILTAADSRTEEKRYSRFARAAQAARYVAWPQTKVDNGQIEWVILEVKDRSIIGPSFPGWESAMEQIAQMVGV